MTKEISEKTDKELRELGFVCFDEGYNEPVNYIRTRKDYSMYVSFLEDRPYIAINTYIQTTDVIEIRKLTNKIRNWSIKLSKILEREYQ